MINDGTSRNQMIQVSSFGPRSLSPCPRCSQCSCSCIGCIGCIGQGVTGFTMWDTQDIRVVRSGWDQVTLCLSGPWDLLCSIFQRIPKDSKERIPKDSIKQPETFTFAVMPGPTMLEWMAGTVSDHKPQGRGKCVLTYFINIFVNNMQTCKQYCKQYMWLMSRLGLD